MRNYESIFIVHPETFDEAVDQEVSKITELIQKENGQVSHVEKWGKRRLAYIVKKQRYGIFVLIRFTGNPDLVSKLDHYYRFRESVLKFQTIILTELALKSYSKAPTESKSGKDSDDSDDSEGRHRDERAKEYENVGAE